MSLQRDRRISVIGAGNGGCAFAADLTERGWDVLLYNRTAARLAPFRESGGIVLSDEGGDRLVSVGKLSDHLEEALSWSDRVILSVPTSTLGFYARAMGDHMRPRHWFLLSPGHTGGALYFRQEAMRVGVPTEHLHVAETHTLPYIARLTSPTRITIWSRSALLLMAALPAKETDQFSELFGDAVPGLQHAQNILETSLTNVNAVMHPAGALMNAGWIEHPTASFKFYSEGVTKSVGSVIDAVDRERRSVGRLFGLELLSLKAEFLKSGMVPAIEDGVSTADVVRFSGPNTDIEAPRKVDDRFLREDVGFGLAPMVELAKLENLSTPVMEALIALSNAVGLQPAIRHLSRRDMGLAAAKSAAEVLQFVDVPAGRNLDAVF